MEALGNVFYKPSEKQIWTGRIDGETPEFLRWHQLMTWIDLDTDLPSLEKQLVFLGLCCDEGVKRNQGRVGAKDAPAASRKLLAGLPHDSQAEVKLADAGDIICVAEDMEAAQYELAKRVAQILDHGGFPIVLGGGHEVTYGHFNGLKAHNTSKKLGIINLDAHFDIRSLVNDQ